MEHHAPHSGAAFEGYYNKFSLPSGANIVVVICKVEKGKSRANLVTLTYVPANNTSKIYQKEAVVDEIVMKRKSKDGHAFAIDIPELGYAEWNADSSADIYLKDESFTFKASISAGIPWSQTNPTPEGLFIRLPLPLHWHVQSLSSTSKFRLLVHRGYLGSGNVSGEAIVHQEKNWATSFPSAHIWAQCREKDRGFCCAGGKILGMEAFLLGYRSPDLNLDFRPPFALRFAGVGPFMSYKTDWENRSFELNVKNFRQKILIRAQAPKGSFFPLSAPFSEGHRKNFLNQSFRAKIEISIYKASWVGPWQLVREDVFENGSLEFGGGYYPLAGSESEFN